jgi:hypothetical protein
MTNSGMNYTNPSHTHMSTNGQSATAVDEDEQTRSPLGGGSSSMFADQQQNTGNMRMNSDMKATTHGHFSGTNNSMPIREAKEEQEMSHQRLHLGKSGSTGYQHELE